MTDPGPRRRVGVAVTQDAPDGVEVLVFDDRDYPEAGTQLPGGGIDPGGTLETAAVREVAEEIGRLVDRQGEFLGALHRRSGPANTTVPPEAPRS